MTKRQRSLIFIVLTLAFFIITPVIILFSQGYLFDSKNLRLVQSGGIFIKSQPESTLITIQALPGGKPKFIQAKNSLLGSGGTLIKNLLPQKYLVSVKPTTQDNTAWQKEFEVNPLQVSKATRIIFPILKPDMATSSISNQTPRQIAAPPNNKKEFLFLDPSGKLFRFQNATSTLLAETKKITGFPQNEDILKIIPSGSGRNFLALSKTNGIVLSETQGVFLASSFFKLLLQNEKLNLAQVKFFWHPHQDQILFALTAKGGYFFDLEKQEYAKFTEKKIVSLTASHFLAENGNIYTFNYLAQNSEEEYLKTGLKIENAELQELEKNIFLLRTGQNGLWLIEESRIKKIAANVKNWTVSKDHSRLTYLDSSGQLSAYFLKDVFDDLLYKKDETLYLGQTEQSQDIYFAHYNWQILAVSNNDAKLYEIDKRLPVNTHQISLGRISTIIDFEGQTLTWLDNNLLKSAKILP